MLNPEDPGKSDTSRTGREILEGTPEVRELSIPLTSKCNGPSGCIEMGWHLCSTKRGGGGAQRGGITNMNVKKGKNFTSPRPMPYNAYRLGVQKIVWNRQQKVMSR